MTRVAVVRRPSPALAAGIVTYVERLPVDVSLALEQWAKYVDALRDAGWAIEELDPDESPDSVFVEDVLVVYDGTVVVTRPGAPERRRELLGRRLDEHVGRACRRPFLGRLDRRQS